MKVKVTTKYTTFFECEVDVTSLEEAKAKSAEVFWNTPDKELHGTFFKNRKFVEEECEILEF